MPERLLLNLWLIVEAFEPHNRWAGGAMLEKIVSGGQTGVDRAALDVAIGLPIAQGLEVSHEWQHRPAR